MSRLDSDISRKYPELTFAAREVATRDGVGGRRLPSSEKRVRDTGYLIPECTCVLQFVRMNDN